MNLDDPEELKKTKKYCRFQSELQSCLLKVERTPLSDWASLNNGLVHIQRVIDSSTYAELPVIPERLLLCRVLGKCLDPMGAMGVHKKAVETLSKVCTKLGPSGIAASLPLLSVGVLQLLPCAAMQTRPDILSLMEQHFLTLPIESLALCLPGIMAATVSSLEESDTSDLYRRSMGMLQGALRRFEERNTAQTFYHALWSTVRNAPTSRVGALILLRLLLKKATPLPTVEEQLAANTTEFACPSQLVEASLASMDTPLVLAALRAALGDASDKALRIALDTLVFHFPLHEEGVLTFLERVSLMTAALRVLVTNPQNSTLRRVFMWIYGGNEYNATYFRSVSSRYIAQSLIDMFCVAEQSTTAAEMETSDATVAFEALLALLSRPEGEEHFTELLPEVTSSVCGALQCFYQRGAWSNAQPTTQKIFRLLDWLPWNHFLKYVQECGQQVQGLIASNAPSNEVVAVLKTMLDILDATRLHYIALPTSAPHLPQVVDLCVALCEILQSTQVGTDGGHTAKATLEVFHVAYFGIARGLLSHTVAESASAATSAANRPMAQQPPPTPPSREGTETFATEEAATVAPAATALSPATNEDTIAVVTTSFCVAYVKLCNAHSGVSGPTALSPEDLFSTTVSGSGNDRGEVRLFGDMCDTLLSLLSHDRNQQKGGAQQLQQQQGDAAEDGWLRAAERVVFACGTNIAVCAANLIFEAYCNDSITQQQLLWMRNVSLLKRLLAFLWSLFTVSHSEHHVQLAKLFMKLDKRPEIRDILTELMAEAHPANCRQYYTLFRLVAEQGIPEYPFEGGLLMMMSSLSSIDASVRLIGSSFVEQSLPYLNRIVEPLLSKLTSSLVLYRALQVAEGEGAAVERPMEDPTAQFLRTVKVLLQTSSGHSGATVVQRLWSLPVPSFGRTLVDLIDEAPSAAYETCATPMTTTASDQPPSVRSRRGTSAGSPKDPFRDGADNDMIVNNVFSLMLYIAVRLLRSELKRYHDVSMVLAQGGHAASAGPSSDELMLAASSVPNITQGDESRSGILALEVILDALRCSTAFADPPETVANVAAHCAQVATELLGLCIGARLPTSQLLLLDLYMISVGFLDHSGRAPTGGGRRARGHSESSAGDEVAAQRQGEDARDTAPGALSTSPPLVQGLSGSAVSRSHSKSKRLMTAPASSSYSDPSPCGHPVLTRGTLRLVRQGMVGAALAEVHPVMGCYGLLSHWKTLLTSLLPLFHDLLHDAVYEAIATYTTIVRAVRERPLSPSTGFVMQRCFQGLTDVVQFLFRPSTRLAESNPTAHVDGTSSRKLESVTQLPMWLLQQGLGNNQPADTAASNYDLAMKELMVCMETLVPTCLDTFLCVRKISQDDSNLRHRDAAASLQAIRLQVEAPIKVLIEALLKDAELDAFERLMWAWSKRNHNLLLNGTFLSTADTGDDALVAELLCSSAGVTPISVVVVCDQLLQRHRRGAVKALVQSKTLGEMSFDATVFHFLHAIFYKCRGADRFDRVLTPLLDAMLAHVSAWGSVTVSPLSFPMMLALLTTLARRFSAAVLPQGSNIISGTNPPTAPSEAIARTDRRGVAVFGKLLECLSTTGTALAESDEIIPASLKLIAEVLPDFASFFITRDQIERIAESFGMLYNRVLGPTVLASMHHKGGYDKILQLAPRVNTALAVVVAFLASGGESMVPKKLKNELIDVLFSPNFFKMTRQSVSQWKVIFERLTTDRTINSVILQRFNAPPTPQSMLTAIVQSHDDEASNRGRLLKRLAFYVFSTTNIDREFINGIREKIGETIRQFGRHNKLVPVRYALFVFRVLMTRIPPQLLAPFWPVVLPELIRCLTQKPTGDDDFYLAMEALKVIDFATCVIPSDFQVFRWAFLDDAKSVEQLYQGSTSNLRSAHLFIPLVRSLAGDGTTRPVALANVRREMYPRSTATADAKAGGPGATVAHRPLLAIPERCYFDIRGIETVCSALQRLSNCTVGGASALDDDQDDDEGVSAAMGCEERQGLVRVSDRYDTAYIDWLLEAEFLHVGVAASEQKALQQVADAKLQMQLQGGAVTLVGTSATRNRGQPADDNTTACSPVVSTPSPDAPYIPEQEGIAGASPPVDHEVASGSGGFVHISS